MRDSAELVVQAKHDALFTWELGVEEGLLDGRYRLLPLTARKPNSKRARTRPQQYAIVDTDQFDKVQSYPWQLRHAPYGATVATSPKYREPSMYLHRYIMCAARGVTIDHKNGNVLDNRKENLRPATPLESSRNIRKKAGSRSIYKGVFAYNKSGRWIASIRDGKVRHRLGVFNTEEEAALAYDEAARRIHGAFACVNFPKPGERCALREIA